jgi:hypothetical protein
MLVGVVSKMIYLFDVLKSKDPSNTFGLGSDIDTKTVDRCKCLLFSEDSEPLLLFKALRFNLRWSRKLYCRQIHSVSFQ